MARRLGGWERSCYRRHPTPQGTHTLQQQPETWEQCRAVLGPLQLSKCVALQRPLNAAHHTLWILSFPWLAKPKEPVSAHSLIPWEGVF